MSVELPEDLQIDLDSLTLGEVEDVEDLTGLSLAALSEHLNSGSPPIRVLRALIFVTLRRQRPELAFDDTRDIRLNQLPRARAAEGGDAVDPTTQPVASSSGAREA